MVGLSISRSLTSTAHVQQDPGGITNGQQFLTVSPTSSSYDAATNTITDTFGALPPLPAGCPGYLEILTDNTSSMSASPDAPKSSTLGDDPVHAASVNLTSALARATSAAKSNADFDLFDFFRTK